VNLPRRVTYTALTVLIVGGALVAHEVSTTQTAHAAGYPEYTVDNTTAAGGVYARFTPHTDDTSQTPEYGVYPGDTMELLCGVTDGSPVGPYSNQAWHFVRDLDNPGEGPFWLNDHYIDSPNTVGQLAPGESVCPNENPDPLALAPVEVGQWPWQIPPTSVHHYVDHVEWLTNTLYGPTLAVHMTPFGYAMARFHLADAFREAMSDAHMWDDSNLHDQFVCHAVFPTPKLTWDLDMGRPDPGTPAEFVHFCNTLASNGTEW
jgi:uncharacterized protein DUF2599